MVFVQSLRGLSHTKLEDTKAEHLELSVQALDRLTADEALQESLRYLTRGTDTTDTSSPRSGSWSISQASACSR